MLINRRINKWMAWFILLKNVHISCNSKHNITIPWIGLVNMTETFFTLFLLAFIWAFANRIYMGTSGLFNMIPSKTWMVLSWFSQNE